MRLETKRKEECVLRYKKGESIERLEQEYGVSGRSIFRWLELYDGTMESLENKSCRPLTPHPNQMPPEEEQRLIEIVKANPNISDQRLSELLGTNRPTATLYRKREKIFGKRRYAYKYDYSTIFNKEKVDANNREDAMRGIIPERFFTIEVLPDLYLRQNDGSYPVCITPYFSVALRYESRDEALKLVETLRQENMRWIPKVVEVKDGQTVE